MSEGLEDVFTLLDKVSPTLQVMEGHLAKTEKSFAAVDKAIKALDAAERQARFASEKDPMKKYRMGLELMKGQLQDTHGGLDQTDRKAGLMASTMGFVSGVTQAATTALMSFASAAAHTGVDVIKFAIHAASFKKNMVAGFELMSGSKDEAEQTFSIIKRFADATPFKEGDVMTLFRGIRSAGLEMRESEDILAGIFDVTALLEPEKQAQANESLTRSLLKMQAQGKLTMESLQMMNDAAMGTPVNQAAIFKQIAAMRGISEKQVPGLLSSGAISASEGITAFLRTVQEGVDKGGPLGKATRKFGVESFEGQISTLESRLQGLFQGVDISPLTGILVRLNELLSDQSPTGQRIIKFANETLGGMFKKASEILTEENIEHVLDELESTLTAVADAAAAFGKGFGGAFEGFGEKTAGVESTLAGINGAVGGKNTVNWKEFGAAVAELANALIKLVNAGKSVGNLFANDGIINRTLFKALDSAANDEAKADALARAEARQRELGGAAAKGLAAGVGAGTPLAADAGGALAQSVADNASAVLDIHSPSRVMERLGAAAAVGWNEGLESHQADTAAAYDSLVSPPPPANMNGGGRGGGDVNVTVHIANVHAGADASSARAIAGELRDALQTELVQAFEQLDLGAA